MSQYVIFTHTRGQEFLPAQKTFFGESKRYSDDAILAAANVWVSGIMESDYSKYSTLEEAQASLIGTTANPPIYTIDYTEAGPHIVSATHAGLNYNLSTAWQYQKELLKEMLMLENRLEQYADTPEICDKISNFKNQIISLEGIISYQELTEVCKATNQFLEHPNPAPEKIAEYKELAEHYKNHSILGQALCIGMLALAVAFAALTVTLAMMTPAAPIATSVYIGTKSLLCGALGTFGLYAERQQSEHGLCSSIKEIASTLQQP